jgi:hypothetical protein
VLFRYNTNIQMEDFSHTKGTMDQLNKWANEINKKSRTALLGDPGTESTFQNIAFVFTSFSDIIVITNNIKII